MMGGTRADSAQVRRHFKTTTSTLTQLEQKNNNAQTERHHVTANVSPYFREQLLQQVTFNCKQTPTPPGPLCTEVQPAKTQL